MNNSEYKSNILFIILFFLIVYSIVSIYYKYIVKDDFIYFLNEEEIPDSLDLSSYPK